MSCIDQGRMTRSDGFHLSVLADGEFPSFFDYIADLFSLPATGGADLFFELEGVTRRAVFTGLRETVLHQQQVDATLVEDSQHVVKAADIGLPRFQLRAERLQQA